MSEYKFFSYDMSDLSRLPQRSADSNKGTFGRVLCVCGSYGMAGAAYLAAKAVLRTGAGLCEILTPRENLPILQTLLPEAIVCAYDGEEPDLLAVEKAVLRADAIVLGCGIGVTRASLSVVGRVLRCSEIPTVIDADALNIISRNPSLKKYLKGRIITPHPMEMSRLTSQPVSEITAFPDEVCHSFAEKYGCVCALKGHKTRVSDGTESIYVNCSGNSGMATAGSGDVLAGIIGGILSQGRASDMSPMEATCLGVYIHGLCGDVAATQLGEYSLMASDIISSLPKVLKQIKG